jgi:aspartyl-tRNA(Asn)/glutamyl-tRNA(Gln) amidotransferase subunit C
MLDRATVAHIAELARLGLDEDELEALGAQLGHILDYVDQLAALDLTSADVPPRAGPRSVRLRPDKPAPPLAREAVLALAPRSEAGYVVVPAFLD